MSFAEKDLILKMDTEASSTIETGMDKGHKGFHMHNMTCQIRVVTFAETITGWKPINIKSGKMLLNGKILPILSCFLFLFDENKDRVLVSAKNKGQKYIKLADIATLTQLVRRDSKLALYF